MVKEGKGELERGKRIDREEGIKKEREDFRKIG